MPRYYPNTRFSDCWSSVGDITFYHRDGICYFKSKPKGNYAGTAGQLSNLELHRRAIASWRNLLEKEHSAWNHYARRVASHRPPFSDGNHISGYNLFVSAYHGHAQLGNEHIPQPKPFRPFPVFSVDFISGELQSDGLVKLNFRLTLQDNEDASRFRVLFKVQIVKPGEGKNPGLMRNFLSNDIPFGSLSKISVNLPLPSDSLSPNPEMFGLHIRYLLIDSETGYRSQYQSLSTLFECFAKAK